MLSPPTITAAIVPTAEELVLLQGLRAQTAAKLIPVKAVENRGPVSNSIFNPIEDFKTKRSTIDASKAVKACELLKAKSSDTHFFKKTKPAPRLVDVNNYPQDHQFFVHNDACFLFAQTGYTPKAPQEMFEDRPAAMIDKHLIGMKYVELVSGSVVPNLKKADRGAYYHKV